MKTRGMTTEQGTGGKSRGEDQKQNTRKGRQSKKDEERFTGKRP